MALPLVLWLLLRSPATTTPAPNASTSAVHAASPAAPASGAAALVAPATTFELTLTSQPAQASVSEDGVVLGRTPLSLSIERESVAEKPRRFILRREGYSPYAVEQRDSDVPVELSLKLVPVARAGAPARGPRVKPTPATKEVPATKRSDAQNLDIRLRR